MTERIIVAVNEGKVRGVRQKSTFSGAEYYSFFGIPYAQPPVGRLRFRDPVKVKPWKDVLDATTEKDGFIQFSFAMYKYKGSEENLYVNVHTPKLPCAAEPSSLRPVIVLIHPGSFTFGSPDAFDFGSPNFFIHNDIVYVTIAYRLHILGYLDLELPECSGNQGIKDIILALRWIKDNIRSFNGDPDNVTLIGSSSSAVAVHILMLSPHLEDSGLFHKAVVMGMYLFANTVVVNLENKTVALELARNLGFEGDDPKKLLEFLRKVPALKLTSCVKQFRNSAQEAPVYPIYPFQPGEDSGENPVITQMQKRISSTMKIPVMFGVCENEAVMGFTTKLRYQTEKNYRKSFLQNKMGWMRNLTDDQLAAINQRIDSFYLKNHTEDNVPISVKVDILTDATFSEVYDSFINVIAKELPESVYVYKFEYEGSLLTMKDLLPWNNEQKLRGTYHSSDFTYWAYSTEPRTTETRDMVAKFTKLICTFARNGDPNYEGIEQRWISTTPRQPCYMRINRNLKMAEGKLYGERSAFWDQLMEDFKND